MDDLLDRVCIQESVVINATARINSTEVVGLIESANALPGLEDRYRILRVSCMSISVLVRILVMKLM